MLCVFDFVVIIIIQYLHNGTNLGLRWSGLRSSGPEGEVLGDFEHPRISKFL